MLGSATGHADMENYRYQRRNGFGYACDGPKVRSLWSLVQNHFFADTCVFSQAILYRIGATSIQVQKTFVLAAKFGLVLVLLSTDSVKAKWEPTYSNWSLKNCVYKYLYTGGL
jgi:hypothetical protein